MQPLLLGTGYTLIYYVLVAGTALTLRRLTRIPDEIFRKLLHCIILGALPVYVYGFPQWWQAVLSCAVFALVVYPILKYFERFSLYSSLTTERKSGELKNSLLVVFSMFAVVITVCWGLLGDRLLVLCCVYAWGFGDAAAALVGKRFGRHKIPRSKKSWEGTLSMFGVSFACVLALLLVRGGLALPACTAVALATAAASAATELYTPGGYDTITCPLCATAVMLPLLSLFGGL